MLAWFRENWRKNYPWHKKMFFHIGLPSAIWLAMIVIPLELLAEKFTEDQKTVSIFTLMAGFYAIWITGFHRSGLLTKENPSYIVSRIMYGITIFHMGIVFGIVFLLY